MNVVRGVCRHERGYKTLTWQDGGLAHYKYRSDKQNCYLFWFFLKKRRCSVYTRTKQSLIHHYAFKVFFLLLKYRAVPQFIYCLTCSCTDFSIYMKYLPLDKLSNHQSIQHISRISFLKKSTTIKKNIQDPKHTDIHAATG